jgi:filamentous hemagglutinin
VVSDAATTIAAGNNLTIQSATNTSSSSSFRETKQSGMLDDGGGISVGSQERSTQQQAQGTSAAASTVGSIAGSVTLQAGVAYKQVGSDVIAPRLGGPSGSGDITILAKKVDIVEARETSRQETEC